MTTLVPDIVLIGPMGSGKTTIGRLLAARLHKRFIDSDARIEARTGVDIPTIFAIEGEAGFREWEHRILTDIANEAPGRVLATGGGAVLDPRNPPLLRQTGRVIYLDVGIEEQLRRIRHDRQRPLLQVDDLPRRLKELAETRNGLYQKAAHWRVQGNGQRADQVLRRILGLLQRESSTPAS